MAFNNNVLIFIYLSKCCRKFLKLFKTRFKDFRKINLLTAKYNTQEFGEETFPSVRTSKNFADFKTYFGSL